MGHPPGGQYRGGHRNLHECSYRSPNLGGLAHQAACRGSGDLGADPKDLRVLGDRADVRLDGRMVRRLHPQSHRPAGVVPAQGTGLGPRGSDLEQGSDVLRPTSPGTGGSEATYPTRGCGIKIGARPSYDAVAARPGCVDAQQTTLPGAARDHHARPSVSLP